MPSQEATPAEKLPSSGVISLEPLHRGQALAVRGVHQERAELVAPEPSQDVTGAERTAHPLGGLDQHAVALVVAARVVDLLEAVQVEQEEADRECRP